MQGGFSFRICSFIKIHFFFCRNENAGKLLMVFSWIFSITWFIFTAFKLQYGFSPDVMTETIIPIYMSSFYRFAPYFCGTVAAWILNTHKSLLLNMTQERENNLWKASTFLFLVIIFMEMDRSLSTLPTVFIAVLGHHANSLFVCWIILASATGKGVWWSRLLENTVFQHFSKLTYGIYLVNSILSAFIFSLSENSTNHDVSMMVR